MVFFFFESLLWLLVLMFDGYSFFPTYGLWLHSGHSIRYITSLDLQFSWCKILYCFPDFLLVNIDVLAICLQHRLSLLLKQGRHLSITYFCFTILLL